MTTRTPPDRATIIAKTAQTMYSRRILNNSHRGDVVEIIVLEALGDEWIHVGLGWTPWDLERGVGADRVRIQVRQTAAWQLWGQTKLSSVHFGWKKNAKAEGWFCDIFVVGVHPVKDEDAVDQLDVNQWQFLVIPVGDLRPGQNSMGLMLALKRWQPVTWAQLPDAVEQAIERWRAAKDVLP